eukprot:5761920-Amphidinium_carterae.1
MKAMKLQKERCPRQNPAVPGPFFSDVREKLGLFLAQQDLPVVITAVFHCVWSQDEESPQEWASEASNARFLFFGQALGMATQRPVFSVPPFFQSGLVLMVYQHCTGLG